MKTFKVNGIFSCAEDVLSVVPFCFNDTNSDIDVCMYIDGLVSIAVCYGTGKGWDTLDEDLQRECEYSNLWGSYTMGYE